MIEAIDALDEGGYGKADPHQRIFEKGVEYSGALIFFSEHGDGELDQWENQALVFDPLFAQDNHNGNHRHVECQHERHPQRQRGQP